MSQSRQALVARALMELMADGGAGQAPSAEDAATADAEVEPLLSDLATRNIWQWGDPDQIDDDAFIHLAKLLANSIAVGVGGKPSDENVRLLAESRLRELKPVILSGQPQRVEYF